MRIELGSKNAQRKFCGCPWVQDGQQTHMRPASPFRCLCASLYTSDGLRVFFQ